MTELNIYSVSRIKNGWLVHVCDGFGTIASVLFCASWEDVEKTARKAAFPFPDPNDPRGGPLE